MQNIKTVAVILVLLGSAPMAFGETPAAPSQDNARVVINAVTCPAPSTPSPDTSAADQRSVETAYAAYARGGFAALGAQLETLQTVVNHAPACYPQIERSGGTIIVRSEDLQDFLYVSAVIGADAQSKDLRVEQRANTYPFALLLLGSYANEMRRFDEAVTWLDRGLALQPHNSSLVSEKVASLGGLQRPGEAVELVQGLLNAPDAPMIDRSRFERLLGINLIDLNRLDEAEAALRESIRLEPNNPRAQHELDYIAQLRAGRPPSAPNLTILNDPNPGGQK